MKTLLNLIQRAWLVYQIRALEIHIDGQSQAIEQTYCPSLQLEMICARQAARRELVRLRGEYNGLLPIGQRRVWSQA